MAAGNRKYLYLGNNTMLVSYSPQRNKSVVVLSTMHDQPEVDNDLDSEAKKPYAILDYNTTKTAVDTFDELVTNYSCARTTKRWPMRLFYFLLDAAGVNGLVAFTMTNPHWKNHSGSTRMDKRRLFLIEVGEALVEAHVQRRALNRMVSGRPAIASAIAVLGLPSAKSEPKKSSATKRGRCISCPRNKEQKVSNHCAACNNFVCGAHCVKTTTIRCMRCQIPATSGCTEPNSE